MDNDYERDGKRVMTMVDTMAKMCEGSAHHIFVLFLQNSRCPSDHSHNIQMVNPTLGRLMNDMMSYQSLSSTDPSQLTPSQSTEN
jgi:hypothetical protein